MLGNHTAQGIAGSNGRRLRRRGVGLIDLFVTFTLLATLISVATPLVVRHGRVMKSQRDYRLALDELSNQLERLTLLPAQQLPGALEQITPSDFVAERLSGAKLSGKLEPADSGTRITLEVSWNEPGRRAKPVALSAWVFPSSTNRTSTPGGTQP